MDVVDRSPENESASGYQNNVSNEDSDEQLHVFSTYSGAPHVQIHRADHNSVLLLASSAETLWHVDIEEGSRIEKIIAQGGVREIRLRLFYVIDSLDLGIRPTTRNKPDLNLIPFERITSQKACVPFAYSWKKDGKGEFRQFIVSVRENTGLVESTYQGAYSPPGSPNVVFKLPFATRARGTYRINVLKTKSPTDKEVVTFGTTRKLLQALGALQEKGMLPTAIPTAKLGSEGRLMEFKRLDVSSSRAARAIRARPNVECDNRGNTTIVGDDRDNFIKCAYGENIHFAGRGKDTVDDSWGDDILYGGPGDDTLDAGWGTDVLVFNKGWGNDELEKTCHYSRYQPDSTLGAAGQPKWRWPYVNFIVFGEGIHEQDIEWVGDKIRNTATGDSITLKDKCFNLVFSDSNDSDK
ncbi:MAG: calcium-binding protein [Gammaproteobacteria bacterium]